MSEATDTDTETGADKALWPAIEAHVRQYGALATQATLATYLVGFSLVARSTVTTITKGASVVTVVARESDDERA